MQIAAGDRGDAERLLQAILSATNDHIYVIAPDGRYEYVSRVANEGVRAGAVRVVEVEGKEEPSLSPEAVQQIENDRQKAFVTGERVAGRARFREADGTERAFEYVYHPLRGAGGSVERVIGIARDVTAYARVVQQFKLVTDAAPVLISYVDDTYRFRYANRAYAEWFGLPLSAVIDHEIREVIGEEAFLHVKPHLDIALQSGERVMYETAMPYERGGRRFVHTHIIPDREEENGPARGFVAVITDITERRQAEEARARREREFAALVEASPDIIARFNTDLRCLYVSPAATRLSGMPAEFFIGKTHAEMGMLPEMCAAADASLRRIFASGQTDHIVFDIPDPQGVLHRFEATGVPLFGADGQVETVMTVSRDVTDRRQAEEQNAALLREQAAAALQQRAFLQDVLYSVSEGKFRLCETVGQLPAVRGTVITEAIRLEKPTLRELRHAVRDGARERDFGEERLTDLLTAVGEASMNAVVHGGGGTGSVYADAGVVQVWIMDQGRGIAVDDIHKTFRRGYTTAGTLGHGFYLMLRTVDRVWLLTNQSGTIVVLEQERIPPLPAWF